MVEDVGLLLLARVALRFGDCTYHNSHASALDKCAEYQDADYNTPTLNSSLYASSDDDYKADQCT